MHPITNIGSKIHQQFCQPLPIRLAGGEEVVNEMIATYFSSGYQIRAMLSTLFHSEFFKSEAARFARVKGPV